MRIGVVGACGYLGSALMRTLPAAFPSASFIFVDDFSTSSRDVIRGLAPTTRAVLLEGDILEGHVRVPLGDVDVVMNLLPPTEQAGKIKTLDALASFLAPRGIPLVHVSSTSVYGTATPVETELPIEALKPMTRDGLAASLAERRLREFGVEEKLHFVVLRLAPLVGAAPGMHLKGEPQSWIWSVVSGAQPEVSPGILEHSRPYVTVEDACLAVAKIVEQERFDREPWNVFSAHVVGERFLDVIREQVPTVGHRTRSDSRPEYYAGPSELALKKLERAGIPLTGSPIEAYREVLASFSAFLPRKKSIDIV